MKSSKKNNRNPLVSSPKKVLKLFEYLAQELAFLGGSFYTMRPKWLVFNATQALKILLEAGRPPFFTFYQWFSFQMITITCKHVKNDDMNLVQFEKLSNFDFFPSF